MDERERANHELVTRFCREWDAPHLTTEAMAPYFTDDAVYHNVPLPPITMDATEDCPDRMTSKSMATSDDFGVLPRILRTLSFDMEVSSMKRVLTIGILTLAVFAMGCVDLNRLTIEAGASSAGEEGIELSVVLMNVGDDQEITSVEGGMVAIDTAGHGWVPSDSCSTLVGQVVSEGEPLVGTLCFPYQKVDDDTGELVDYIPADIEFAFIMLTDNIFVSDGSQYHIIPVGTGAVPPDVASAPVAEPEPCTVSTAVGVTVWERISNGQLYLSTRPEGGRWETHTPALTFSESRFEGWMEGSAVTVDVELTVDHCIAK